MSRVTSVAPCDHVAQKGSLNEHNTSPPYWPKPLYCELVSFRVGTASSYCPTLQRQLHDYDSRATLQGLGILQQHSVVCMLLPATQAENVQTPPCSHTHTHTHTFCACVDSLAYSEELNEGWPSSSYGRERRGREGVCECVGGIMHVIEIARVLCPCPCACSRTFLCVSSRKRSMHAPQGAQVEPQQRATYGNTYWPALQALPCL